MSLRFTQKNSSIQIIVTALVFAITLLPLLLSTYPHLLDFPGHLARVKILIDRGIYPLYQSLYAHHIGSFLRSGIAFDAIVLFLSKFMSLLAAGKVFIGLALGTIFSGTIALNYGLYRKIYYWPLISALILFNFILQFGFLNYLFGIGLMLWSLALWMILADRPDSQKLILGSILAIIIYLVHLVAFVLYLVALSSYEIQRSATGLQKERRFHVKNLIIGILPFIVPILIYLVTSDYSRASLGVDYHPMFWKWKCYIVLRIFLWDGKLIDLMTVGGFLSAALLVFLRGRFSISPLMLGPIGILSAVFLAAPAGLLGGWNLDKRIPVAIVFLIIAAGKVTFSNSRWRKALFLVAALTLTVRTTLLTFDWIRYDKDVNEVITAFESVAPNSTFFQITEGPSYPDSKIDASSIGFWQPPLHHVIGYSILQRPVFVPDLWAEKGQHTIAITELSKNLYRLQSNSALRVKSESEISELIGSVRIHHRNMSLKLSGEPIPPLYIFFIYPDKLWNSNPHKTIRMAEGSLFILWRVEEDL